MRVFGLGRRTLDSLTERESSGRRALVRVDYNVPMEGRDGERRIVSDVRIRATLPTLRELAARHAVIVLASHLGRPEGKPDSSLSLRPAAERLGELVERPVVFLPAPSDEASLELVLNARAGEIFLLENLRFDPGETANDPDFARRLAAFGELFVQDAFGTCHRAHASTVGVTDHLDPCLAGRLVERELAAFSRVLEAEPPFVAVMGGAKVAGKVETVRGIAERADRVFLAGGMANTFLMACGMPVGDSLFEPEQAAEAERLMASFGDRIVLPADVVVAREIASEAERRTIPADQVEAGWRILDVGPRTVDAIGEGLRDARTVFWNGPLGVFETPPFDAATRAVAKLLARQTDRGAYTVVGGGDSAAAIEEAGLADRVSHVSTGGGAALELVSGVTLPGIAVLDPASGGDP
ncbi:MAG TPA: phosphoglycerate kinase [Gemmatimonadota bacterium]|nr:phosphoglycerate kinase [Gemmatimonadota bacterium]